MPILESRGRIETPIALIVSTLPPPTMLPPTFVPAVEPVPIMPIVPPAEVVDRMPAIEAHSRFIADLASSTKRHQRRQRRHDVVHRILGTMVVALLGVGAYAMYQFHLFDIRRYQASAEEELTDAADINIVNPAFSIILPAPADETRSEPQPIVEGVQLQSSTWTIKANDTTLIVEEYQMVGTNTMYNAVVGLDSSAQALIDRMGLDGTTVTELPPTDVAGTVARHFTLRTSDGEGIMDIVRNGPTMLVFIGTCEFACPPARYTDLTSSLRWLDPTAVTAPATPEAPAMPAAP